MDSIREEEAPKAVEMPWRSRIRRRVFVGALLSPSFLIINALATIVAAYGLLANSIAVVIGAMLIATLLGPISGMALALVDADYSLLRRALVAEGAGAILVISIAFVIGWIHKSVPLGAEILSRTHPSLLDLMIALAGGAAGGYATVNRRLSQGLVGTAIATALVPPLASCGICFAHGEMRLAWGAFLLFFANLVSIQFASSIVLFIAGFRNLLLLKNDLRGHLIRGSASAAALLVLGVVFALRFAETMSRQTYEAAVRKTLERALSEYPGAHLSALAITDDGAKKIILAVVRTPYSLSPKRVAAVEAQLPAGSNVRPELHIQSVLVKEVTSSGYLHQSGEAEAPEDQLGRPPSEGGLAGD